MSDTRRTGTEAAPERSHALEAMADGSAHDAAVAASQAVRVRGAAEMVPIEHETCDRVVRTMVFAVPPAALGVGGWLGWGGVLIGHPGVARDYLHAHGCGITVGLSPAVHPSQLEDHARAASSIGLLGSTAVEGPLIEWVATHRKHHRSSIIPATRTAHISTTRLGCAGRCAGWAMRASAGRSAARTGQSRPARYAKDLLADRDRSIRQPHVPLWVMAGLAVPFGVGVAPIGWVVGGPTGLLWGGGARVLTAPKLAAARVP